MNHAPSDRPSSGIDHLLSIISRLRAPDGCPWDREQTPLSVRKYILEEAYELTEAIDEGTAEDVAEELGDLLFMLLFLASMYEEQGLFDLESALARIAAKMIRRHPHIFGDTQVRGTADVVANWQAIKAQESEEKGRRHSALGNLPKALPSLQRAYRVGERASRVGFDWTDPNDVWEKVAEEEEELKAAMRSESTDAVRKEMGDVLFTLANMSRLLGINPENALHETVARFVRRFQAMETRLHAQGKELAECSLDEKDKVWGQVKAEENP